MVRLWAYVGVLVLLATINSVQGDDAKTEALKKVLAILDDPQRYSNEIRPSHNGSATHVKMQMYLRSMDIDDFNMRLHLDITFRMQWMDHRLAYDGTGVDYVTLMDPMKVWVPDAFFRGSVSKPLTAILPESYLRVHPDGMIVYSIRMLLDQVCYMDLHFFPHDTQMCEVQTASYGYTTDDIIISPADHRPVSVDAHVSLAKFEIMNVSQSTCNIETVTGMYSCISTNMKFNRLLGTYMVGWYIPCVFLVVVSFFGFLIPAQQFVGRVLLTLVPLITLTAFANIIKTSVAPVAYTKAIDVFTGMSLSVIFCALIHVIVCEIHGNKSAADKSSESMEEGGGGGKSSSTDEATGLRRLLLKVKPHAEKISRGVLIGYYCVFIFFYFVAYCGTG